MELLRHTASGKLEAAGPVTRRRWRSAVARWIRTSLVLLPVSALAPEADLHAQTQENSLEYQVKAAFLLNFTRFVEWPAAAFGASGDAITICVIGEDPFGAILDRTIDGESVSNRQISAQRLPSDGDLQPCHILFISRSEREQVPQIVSRLRGSSILTVSELPGFADEGGMIELLVEAGKARFHVNAATAEAVGLKLSSRLLRVAKEVKGS